MPTHDYEEFITGLSRHRVRYLIVGAHAVAHHARPRAIKGLGLFIDPAETNARRVLAAVKDFFRGADLGYEVADIVDPDWILQLGVAPLRIDIMFRLKGRPEFAKVWKRRYLGVYGSEKPYHIGLDELIATKEAAGSDLDQADVRVLKRVRNDTRNSRRKESD